MSSAFTKKFKSNKWILWVTIEFCLCIKTIGYLLFLVESILCWFIGAIGNKFGKGYKSCTTWTKKILTTAQSTHGELSEGSIYNEEAAQEKS